MVRFKGQTELISNIICRIYVRTNADKTNGVTVGIGFA